MTVHFTVYLTAVCYSSYYSNKAPHVSEYFPQWHSFDGHLEMQQLYQVLVPPSASLN